MSVSHHKFRIRPAAVAGYFYPEAPQVLTEMIREFLARANDSKIKPKALIAPHAGYIYSGPIAANAYHLLENLSTPIQRVILLGPAHRVYLTGIAYSSADYFSTPLGDIPIDKEAIDQIRQLDGVLESDAAHAQEHSLEVHLPFLQMLLSDFKLVPLVVGDARPEQVSKVLATLWGGDETLIIISSDLSHFHSYDEAKVIDSRTTHAIENLDLDAIGSEQACGCMPMRGLLYLAKQKGMTVTTLDQRNSGDTAGSHDQVVGYGAYSLA